jgi:hypothetical protein
LSSLLDKLNTGNQETAVPLTFAFSIVLASCAPVSQPPIKEKLIRLSLQPMPAPQPALKYSLLPELPELTPGNPVEGYYRALLDQDFSAEKEQFRESALKQADRAARMDKPDWQQHLNKSKDAEPSGSEVLKLVDLAKELRNRLRSEVADNRFEDAIVTLKTMFAMARHLNEYPNLLGNLVGAAVAVMAIDPLQEMLEKPGCPNLYWTLTRLPSPLVSIDRGMVGQRTQFQNELKELTGSEAMTSAQLNTLIARLEKMNAQAQPAQKDAIKTVAYSRANDVERVAAAKKRLIGFGISEERLAKFPALQIILLDEKRQYEVRLDEFLKLFSLPLWQSEEMAAKIEPVKSESLLALGFNGSYILRYRRDQGVLERRFAVLRYIEALRLYAADHQGQLPEKLIDVPVPLPADPFTGKPFLYSREGDTAHLRGSSPSAQEKNFVFYFHYEITIRKP